MASVKTNGKKSVEPKAWYTLQDIVKHEMFPWAASFWSIRNIVAKDRKKDNLLKATITGKGRGTKYHFKGENIISFIRKFEAGKISL